MDLGDRKDEFLRRLQESLIRQPVVVLVYASEDGSTSIGMTVGHTRFNRSELLLFSTFDPDTIYLSLQRVSELHRAHPIEVNSEFTSKLTSLRAKLLPVPHHFASQYFSPVDELFESFTMSQIVFSDQRGNYPPNCDYHYQVPVLSQSVN